MEKNFKMKQTKQQTVATGKRKTAVARAVVKDGSGKVFLNKKNYLDLDNFKKLMISEPLKIAEEVIGSLKYDIFVVTRGGGSEGQTEASRLAIAKALVNATKSDKLKKAFLAYDKSLLVADVRRKEAYKPGDSKARAKRQKSYR